MNLAVPTNGGDAPFVDLVRHSIALRDDTWRQPFPRVDEHGWPLSVEAGEIAQTFLLGEGAAHYPAGTYVLLYEGTGTVELWTDAGALGPASLQPDGVTWRAELAFDPSTAAWSDIHLAITASDASDPVRDVRLLLPGHEKTYETQPFNPAFLALWEDYALMRYMPAQAIWDFAGPDAPPTDVDWSDRMTPEDMGWAARWPYEAMADLGNTLHQDVWVSVPHTASLDYTRQMATLFRERLDPDQRVWVEFSNECWNGISNAYVYAEQQGVAEGLYAPDAPGDAYQAALRWCAVQTVEHTNAFEEVFAEAGEADRVVRVFGAFVAIPWLYHHDGVEGALHESRTSTGNPAYEDVDVVAIATYYGGDIGIGPNTPHTRSWTVDDVYTYLETGTLPPGTPAEDFDGGIPGTVAMVEDWKAVTDTLGLELVAYEGGPHLVVDDGDPDVNRLVVDVLRDPRLYDTQRQLLDGVRDAGLTVHALYATAGPIIEERPWTRFGSIEHTFAGTDEQWRYLAARDWGAENPRWWTRVQR